MADDMLKHLQYTGNYYCMLAALINSQHSSVPAHPTQSETRQAKIFGIKSGAYSGQEPSNTV